MGAIKILIVKAEFLAAFALQDKLNWLNLFPKSKI